MSINNLKVNEISFSKDTIQLILFWAEWSCHCKTQLKILEKLQKKNPDINFICVDSDKKENWDFINSLNVKTFPSIALFKGDYQIIKRNGIQSLEEVNWLIENLLLNRQTPFPKDSPYLKRKNRSYGSKEDEAIY